MSGEFPDGPDGPALPDLSKRDRQEQLREVVIARGFVRIDELAQRFSVSSMTIHRDLDTLESQGWLRKVWGGATAQPSQVHHGDIRHRLNSHSREKRQLGHAALAHVESGQVLVLDDSTTVLQLARLLPERGPLTVITNSLMIMREVASHSQLDLVGLGGVYYPAYDAFLGVQTVETARSLSADCVFLSTTAITKQRCFHQSQETVQVKRTLMDISASRVLLVDHSKFNQRALHQLAPLTDFDLVIVDPETPPAVTDSLRSAGVTLEIASEEVPTSA